MKLIQYPQEDDDASIAGKIISLENTAWPSNTEDTTFPSSPNTYAASFVLIEDDTAVCHVGVRKSILYHKGEEYLAYGLSEVVTHPRYQNRGLATQTIKKLLSLSFLSSRISVFLPVQRKEPLSMRDAVGRLYRGLVL